MELKKKELSKKDLAGISMYLQQVAEKIFNEIDSSLQPIVHVIKSRDHIERGVNGLHDENTNHEVKQKQGTFTVHLSTDKRTFELYDKKPKSNDDTLPWSLIEYFMLEYLDRVNQYIQEINRAGRTFRPTILRNTEELKKNAGVNFMTEFYAVLGENQFYTLYGICDSVSRLHYEKKEIRGGILITDQSNTNITYSFKFSEPFSLDYTKKLRKIIELTNENLHVISDAFFVYGLGTVTNTEEEPVFTITFEGKNKWQVSQGGTILMVVHDGIPNVYKEKINKDIFVQNLEIVYNNLTTEQRIKILTIVEEASKLPHGGLIVISDKAEEEAQRLGNQSFLIEPIELKSDLIKQFTSIDGAILMDWDCNCYAIGVILDGIANGNIGDSTRGSRYNSAVRYCKYSKKRKHKAIAIVISEDGMINVVPESTN